MRILYIIPTFQHPKVRGSDRHYHFLRELSQRHQITLLTLRRVDKIAPEALEEVSSWVEELLTFPVHDASRSGTTTLLNRLPIMGRQAAQQRAIRQSVLQMKQTFQRLVSEKSFDLVLFHGKDCFPVIDGWHELPMVVDFCDATSLRVRTKMRHLAPPRSALLGLRYLQVRRTEKKMVQSTPHLAFISQRDRAAIMGNTSGAVVIPNGIDLAYWTRRTNQPEPHTLIFTGVMDYSPNEDAALHLIDHILPHLRKQIPDVRVLIAGRNPTAVLQARAQQHPDVIVTGFVEDMRDYLEKAAVFVGPLRYASGMQNKLQEALAMKVPVVTTSVAANGLRVKDGQTLPLYVADAPEMFAQRVVDLLNAPEERARLAEEGRQYAERNFSWVRSAAQLEEMCIRAINSSLPASTHSSLLATLG